MKNTNIELMEACVVPKRGTDEDIIIKSVVKPVPKDNEILIKVSFAPVTPTDIVAKKGDPFIERLFSTLFRPKKGIYGEMYTGIIEKIGKEVKDFKVNDKVYGTNGMKLGAYAEYICVKDTTVIRKVPTNVEEVNIVALLDGGITALPFLRDKGQIKAGQKVLIIGASGSVGSNAVQIAKYYDTNVTGVCSTSNLEIVKSLGCDQVIDYTKTNYTEQDIKYDIIFDTVGKSSFKACSKILTEEGRYLITVPTLGIMLKNLFVKNQKGKKALFAATGLNKPYQKMKDLEILEQLLVQKNIIPLIDKVYPIEEMTLAQKHVRTGHKKGNVIVMITK